MTAKMAYLFSRKTVELSIVIDSHLLFNDFIRYLSMLKLRLLI